MPPLEISTVTAEAPGVDGIFHHLLNRGGRTLHDLARGNQIGDGYIENIDDSHVFLSFLRLIRNGSFSEYLFEFKYEIQRLQGRNRIEIRFSQFIADLRLREAFKRHHAVSARVLFLDARGRLFLTGFDSGKNLLSALYHLTRHAGKLCHLDAVAGRPQRRARFCAET